MISKNKIKFIVSLQDKKVRYAEKLYTIEGDKIITEFLDSGMNIEILIAIPEFIDKISSSKKMLIGEILEVNRDELKRVSSLTTANEAIAVINMPKEQKYLSSIFEGITIALNCVQNPGNLGTIIRSAAWFGIKNIVCSEDCADIYNPKVIQASMGSFVQVNVQYTSLETFLRSAVDKNIPVFGAVLEGKSIYDYKLNNRGIILLGNESKGISEKLLPFISDKIMIPGSGKKGPGTESLNVSMAASIIFSEFFRRDK